MPSAENANGRSGKPCPRQQPKSRGSQRRSGGYRASNSARMKRKTSAGSPASSAPPGPSTRKTLWPSSMRGAARKICASTQNPTTAAAPSHAFAAVVMTPVKMSTVAITSSA